MQRELTENEVREHDRVFAEGWGLMKGEVMLADAGPVGKPGWFARRKLFKAIRCFETALSINREGWQSLWALGKIYQRLGQTMEALSYFQRAHDLNPKQTDVAREAGIAAIDAGDGVAAVRFSRAALAAQPDDPGLLANLALAHLINGELQAARQAIDKSLGRAPKDGISRAISKIIEDVTAGKRPQPSTGREIT